MMYAWLVHELLDDYNTLLERINPEKAKLTDLADLLNVVENINDATKPMLTALKKINVEAKKKASASSSPT